MKYTQRSHFFIRMSAIVALLVFVLFWFILNYKMNTIEKSPIQWDIGNTIVGIGAILASFISFVVASGVASAQKRAIVASMREKWIEELREAIANYLHEIGNSLVHKINEGDTFDHIATKDVEKFSSYIKMKVNQKEFFAEKLLEHEALLTRHVLEIRRIKRKISSDCSQHELEKMNLAAGLLNEKFWQIRNVFILSAKFYMKQEWDRTRDEINEIDFHNREEFYIAQFNEQSLEIYDRIASINSRLPEEYLIDSRN